MDDYAELIRNNRCVVGLKQVLYCLAKGECRAVILARDTDEDFKRKVHIACANSMVQVIPSPARGELGQLAGIDVPAGVVGILF